MPPELFEEDDSDLDSFADGYRRDQDRFWKALNFELKGIVEANLELQDAIRITSIEMLADSGAPSDIPAEGCDLIFDAIWAIDRHHEERASTALQYIHKLQQEKAHTLYQHFATQDPDSEHRYKVLWNLEGTTWYDGHKPGDAIWKLYPMDGRELRRFPQVPFKWHSELLYCGEVPRPDYQNFVRLQHVMPDMWGLLMAIVEWGVVRKETTGQRLSPSGLWALRECRRGIFDWHSANYLKPFWDSCFEDGNFGFDETRLKLQTDPMIAEVAFLLSIVAETPNANLQRSMVGVMSMLEDCTGLQMPQLVQRYEAGRFEHHRVALFDHGNDEAKRPNPLLVHEDCPHDIHEYYGQPKFLDDPFRIDQAAQPGLNLIPYLQDSLGECIYILNSVANTTERRLPVKPLRLRHIASRDKFAEYRPDEISATLVQRIDLVYDLPVDIPPLPFLGFGSYANPWLQDYILRNQQQALLPEFQPIEPFFTEDAAFVPAGEDPVLEQEATLEQQTAPAEQIAVDPPLVENAPTEHQLEFDIFEFIHDEDFVLGDHVPADTDTNTVLDNLDGDFQLLQQFLDS